MKKNKTGLKSNLQKVDNHEISTGDYADIPVDVDEIDVITNHILAEA